MKRLLTASLLVGALAYCARGVSATFECERVWSGPSASNSVTDCVANPSHLVTLIQDPIRMQYGAGLVLAIMGLIWWIIGCPLVTICRYVCRCFGSYRRRPGAFFGGAEWDEVPEFVKQDAYNDHCVRAAFWVPIVLAFACAAPMGMLINGGELVKKSYDGVFNDIGGLATYLENKGTAIRQGMTRADGTLIPPLSDSYFKTINDTVADLRKSLADSKSSYQSYIDIARDVGIAVGCVPLVFFIFNALFALFHCRKWLPLINTCFMFLLILIFGVVSLMLLAIALVLRDACGEINAYRDGRKPGIMSWYVIPLCNDVLPFESFKSTIDKAELDNSKLGCEQLLKICKSDNDQYDYSTSTSREKLFYCEGLTDPATQCISFANVSHYINSTSFLKNNLYQTDYGCNPIAATCTFRLCAKGCNPSSLQDTAKTAIDAMDAASAALKAFNDHVRPVLDCNHVLDIALSALASCDLIQEAIWYIGTGALVFQFLAGAGLVSIWVGQKRWFSPDEGEESRKEFGAPSKEQRRAQIEGAKLTNEPMGQTIAIVTANATAPKRKKKSGR